MVRPPSETTQTGRETHWGLEACNGNLVHKYWAPQSHGVPKIALLSLLTTLATQTLQRESLKPEVMVHWLHSQGFLKGIAIGAWWTAHTLPGD